MELQGEDNWGDVRKLNMEKIIWQKIEKGRFFFFSNYKEIDLFVRLNNFPEEPAYTLFKEEVPVINFNDWPAAWIINS